jgi:putative addiction module component (TIGR02574 family)
MESVTIKEKLQEYIESGDEKLLKLMYAVAKEYVEDEDEYELTEEQIAELDRRRESWLSGESKGYTWEEAKKIITSSKGN